MKNGVPELTDQIAAEGSSQAKQKLGESLMGIISGIDALGNAAADPDVRRLAALTAELGRALAAEMERERAAALAVALAEPTEPRPGPKPK